MARRNSPGGHQSQASGLLPRRVHLSVEPTDIALPGKALLQTASECRRYGPDALQGNGQARARPQATEPQHIGSTGVKGIPPSGSILNESHRAPARLLGRVQYPNCLCKDFPMAGTFLPTTSLGLFSLGKQIFPAVREAFLSKLGGRCENVFPTTREHMVVAALRKIIIAVYFID